MAPGVNCSSQGNGFSYLAVENQLRTLDQELNSSFQNPIPIQGGFKEKIFWSLRVRNFESTKAVHHFLLKQELGKKAVDEENTLPPNEDDETLCAPRAIGLYPDTASLTAETLPFHVKWLLCRPLDIDFQLNKGFVKVLRQAASLLDPQDNKVKVTDQERRTQLPRLCLRIEWLKDNEVALRKHWTELRASCRASRLKLLRAALVDVEEDKLEQSMEHLSVEDQAKVAQVASLRLAADEMPRSSRLRTFILDDLQRALPDLLLSQPTFSLIRLQCLDGLGKSIVNRRTTAAALRALADLYQLAGISKVNSVISRSISMGGWEMLGNRPEIPQLVMEKGGLIPQAQSYVRALDWYQEELAPAFSKTWERMDILFEVAKRARLDKGAKEQASCMARVLIQEELELREKVTSGPFIESLKNLALEVSRFRCLCATAIEREVRRLGGVKVEPINDYVKTWQTNFDCEDLFPQTLDLWKLRSIADLDLSYESELGLDQIINNWRCTMQAECPSVVIETVRSAQIK